MHTSARSDCLHCSRTTSLTSRTAVYGPVRTVVWQGSAGDRRPYADQTGMWEITNDKSASIRQPHWHPHLDVKRPTHRLGGPCHKDGSPTTRPSNFPEADLWPASIRCREDANLRPKPNGPLIRDYVLDGDFTLASEK